MCDLQVLIHAPQGLDAGSLRSVQIIKLSLSHKGVNLYIIHINWSAAAHADGKVADAAVSELNLHCAASLYLHGSDTAPQLDGYPAAVL